MVVSTLALKAFRVWQCGRSRSKLSNMDLSMMLPKTFTLAIGLVLSLLGVASCAEPDPLKALEQGETGRVVRIIDGDALVLDTGLTVRLAGIEAPAPERRNRKGAPYAEEAARLLEDLSLGRKVRLIYPGITRDRYDRALAYVVTEDNLGPTLWLNQEMLRRGGARVRLYPDTSRLGELLLASERQARETEIGLWALSSYKIRPAHYLPEDARGFYIVTGTPGTSRPSANERAACTRSLTGTRLNLDIGQAAISFCQKEAPRTPIRIRGYIRDGHMELTHPLNAEAL